MRAMLWNQPLESLRSRQGLRDLRGNKKPAGLPRVAECRYPALRTVIANGLDRTPFLCVIAKFFLIRIFRLFEDIGVTSVFIPLEVVGCGLAAQIAIDALIINVKLAGNVFWVFVCCVCHKFLKNMNSALSVGKHLNKKRAVPALRHRQAAGAEECAKSL
jgi:hypothetical protein